ncbi:23S rRNA (cytosine(1962)-C(5))-methyltransferase RlmI, partial [Serratia proteamaculans]
HLCLLARSRKSAPASGLSSKKEEINIEFFIRRLQQAQTWRDWVAKRDGLDSYRLIAGESDGMPGIKLSIASELLGVAGAFRRG